MVKPRLIVGSFLVAVALAPVLVFGQAKKQAVINKENKTLNALAAYSEYGNFYKFNNRYDKTRGTPFVVSQWSKGDIELTSSKIIRSVPVKIDVYENNILLLRPEGDSIILDNKNIKRLTIHDYQKINSRGNEVERVFKRFPEASSVKLGEAYFEELLAGSKVSLLKLTTKKLQKASTESAYGGNGSLFDEFITKTEYFIRKSDGEFILVKYSYKDLSRIFPEKQEELKSIMAQQNKGDGIDANFVSVVSSLANK